MQSRWPGVSRRWLLAASLATVRWPTQALALPTRKLQFPRDLGSHPDFAIEWWYVTGHLRSAQREFGFQLTFFRSRVKGTQELTSRFAAKQLIFAHAAVTDVAGKKLWHDQRIARDGFGVARASEVDTNIALRDWSLLHANTGYRARAVGTGFQFELSLHERQALLLQGEQGRSRKGPQEQQFSYYYSLPQLQVSGTLAVGQERLAVQGSAWLDHEWSDSLLGAQAVGWDWIGINLQDGSALTAFQLRDADGRALWGGGSFRSATKAVEPRVFGAGEVIFRPLRSWTSALTHATYPVQWLVQTPAGSYTVKAVVDNQELDSRASSGAVYWEGLSELLDHDGQLAGRGYLEMTGYDRPLRLADDGHHRPTGTNAVPAVA